MIVIFVSRATLFCFASTMVLARAYAKHEQAKKLIFLLHGFFLPSY
jgi:hypothetical protein